MKSSDIKKNISPAETQGRGERQNRFSLRPCASARYMVFVFTSLLLLSIRPAFGATDPSKLRIQAHGFPEEAVWVGQRVDFYVTLSMSAQPKGSPRFSLPEVPGGTLLAVSGSPIYGSGVQDGIDFTTWSYKFSFYPHRAGEHTVPPITARVEFPDWADAPPELTAETAEFSMTSRMPDGAEGLSTLVTTTDLEAEEAWDPDITDVRVGDAVTRTITLRAPDVMGMGFPPLSFPKMEGISAYPKPAQVNDRMNRGALTGERIETVVYVCEREGSITLPALVIPWFDLKKEELKQIRFPRREFEVAPNPALSQDQTGSEDTRAETRWPDLVRVAVVLLAVLIICFFGTGRFRKPVRAYFQRRKARREAGEPFHYRRLKSAIKSKDAGRILNLSIPWLQKACSAEGIRSLTAFAEHYGDADFQTSVRNFMESCFGPAASGISWRDPSFSKGLSHARKRCLKKERVAAESLAPLNPT